MILLNVDDLIISCKNGKGIDYVIDFLNIDYSETNIFEGPIIDYLDMLFDFSLPDEVSISMGNMIYESLQELAVANDAHTESRQRVI